MSIGFVDELGVAQSEGWTGCAPVDEIPLDPFGAAVDPLPMNLLIDIVGGLARAEALWRPHLVHGPERRALRLLGTDSYEAWLISWPDAGEVTLHDHGDAAGALVVVDGTLEEVSPGGRRRGLAVGALSRQPVGVAHDVVARGGPAASIHVFSPPLAATRSVDGDGRVTSIDVVAPEPAVHDAASYVRALDQI